MEGRTLLGRLNWQLATVENIQAETVQTKSIRFMVPTWPGHQAGQHVDIRLTAEDGYQVERSYSIASPPEGGSHVTLTVERLDDGEVSPYLTEELRLGDKLELRGPIGGYFVWDEQIGGPLVLIAGGSGIVPLMAMLRHRADVASTVPTRMLYSARTYQDLIYRVELENLSRLDTMLDVLFTLTRERPSGWEGYARRIDAQMLREVCWSREQHPLIFICGPTPFVETSATHLVELGYEPGRIKTERFGATGET